MRRRTTAAEINPKKVNFMRKVVNVRVILEIPCPCCLPHFICIPVSFIPVSPNEKTLFYFFSVLSNWFDATFSDDAETQLFIHRPRKNYWWPALSYLRLIGCGGQRWRLAALWLAGTVEGGVCCAVCYHSTVTCDVNRTNRGNGKDLNTSHRKDKTCKTSCDLCFWRFYKSTSDPQTHI